MSSGNKHWDVKMAEYGRPETVDQQSIRDLACVDRGIAVNLARNVLAQAQDPEITTKGIVLLAEAVMLMDGILLKILRQDSPSD